MNRMLVAAAAAGSMLCAMPASAEPSQASWLKWSNRANALSAYLEKVTSGDMAGESAHGVIDVCSGSDVQMTFGGYPRWAGSLASICDTYMAVARRKASKGRACKVMPRWANDLAKGEPVAIEPSVEPARLRLLALIRVPCDKH